MAEKEEMVVTPKKEKMVEVSENVLTKILSDMADLKKQVGEHEQTASQDQVRKIEAFRATGKLVKSVKLNYFEGKAVIEWRSTHDDVFVDNTGKEHAVQNTEITFMDGTTKEIPQIEFARRKTAQAYEVIAETKKDGRLFFTLLLDGGEELLIDSNYIN